MGTAATALRRASAALWRGGAQKLSYYASMPKAQFALDISAAMPLTGSRQSPQIIKL
jgi:hypothetical protein